MSKPSDYQTMLTQMFEAVEPAFRQHQIETCRLQAGVQLRSWEGQLQGPMPEAKTHGRSNWRFWSPGELVKTLPANGVDPLTMGYMVPSGWTARQEAFKQGRYVPDYEKAEKLANQSVDSAKAHFITKQTRKLESVAGHRTDRTRLDGDLTFRNGVITGYLTVEFGNGDAFGVEMSIKTNCRYQPRYTQFHQFPARFVNVQKGGEKYKTKAEAWFKDNF
jgi:hypothetical protein